MIERRSTLVILELPVADDILDSTETRETLPELINDEPLVFSGDELELQITRLQNLENTIELLLMDAMRRCSHEIKIVFAMDFSEVFAFASPIYVNVEEVEQGLITENLRGIRARLAFAKDERQLTILLGATWELWNYLYSQAKAAGRLSSLQKQYLGARQDKDIVSFVEGLKELENNFGYIRSFLKQYERVTGQLGTWSSRILIDPAQFRHLWKGTAEFLTRLSEFATSRLISPQRIYTGKNVGVDQEAFDDFLLHLSTMRPPLDKNNRADSLNLGMVSYLNNRYYISDHIYCVLVSNTSAVVQAGKLSPWVRDPLSLDSRNIPIEKPTYSVVRNVEYMILDKYFQSAFKEPERILYFLRHALSRIRMETGKLSQVRGNGKRLAIRFTRLSNYPSGSWERSVSDGIGKIWSIYLLFMVTSITVNKFHKRGLLPNRALLTIRKPLINQLISEARLDREVQLNYDEAEKKLSQIERRAERCLRLFERSSEMLREAQSKAVWHWSEEVFEDYVSIRGEIGPDKDGVSRSASVFLMNEECIAVSCQTYKGLQAFCDQTSMLFQHCQESLEPLEQGPRKLFDGVTIIGQKGMSIVPAGELPPPWGEEPITQVQLERELGETGCIRINTPYFDSWYERNVDGQPPRINFGLASHLPILKEMANFIRELSGVDFYESELAAKLASVVEQHRGRVFCDTGRTGFAGEEKLAAKLVTADEQHKGSMLCDTETGGVAGEH